MPPPIRLASTLSRSACAERLREAVDGPFVLFGEKPVIGLMGEDKATLRKRLRGRNSFQTCLRIKLQDVSTGTVLICRGGMHPAVVVFMAFWLGVVVVIGGGVFLASVIALSGAAQSEIPAPIGLLVPPAFLAFGIGLLALGRRMARDEEAFLLDFVAETAQARRLAPEVSTGGTVQ